MNLIKPHGPLPTLLRAEDIEPHDEEVITKAGMAYAWIAIRQMINGDQPLQDIVELFGQDFTIMSPLARTAVHDELTAVAQQVLLEFRREEAYANLDSMLDDVRSHNLLGELGIYRVTRWLAEESWAGCFEPRLTVGDTLASRTEAAQTVLVVATMACRSTYDPARALDDYVSGIL